MGKYLDLSILGKFEFEYKPVGVKFNLLKPQGIEKLDKKLAFCEMIKEAQDGEPFYATKDNHECGAGTILLGMADINPIFESGQLGPKFGVYEDPRANRRIYQDAPRLERGSVNNVAYAAYDRLGFDPDLLIVMAKPSQAEIILRACSYRTGAGWNAKGTTVMGCAWLYLYPYVQGELNVMITGLHHGMKARKTFPEGLLLITIPFDKIPDMVYGLENMEWDLPQYSWGKERHLERMREIAEEVRQELQE